MAYLFASLAVAAFIAVAAKLDAIGKAAALLESAKSATATIGDPGLDDDAKERVARRGAATLLKGLSFLLLTVSASLAVAAAVLVADVGLNLFSGNAAVAALADPLFIVASTGLVVVIAYPAGRGTSGYSRAEKLLHYLAFASLPAQTAVSNLEDRIFAVTGETKTGASAQPVFVTALPRAGTTVLLETLCRTGEFASHTYRDMPFVLCPFLWQQLSGSFQASDALRPRLHGDGLEIGADSPEALEEILWATFWPGKYAADRIRPWTADEDDPEFDRFLARHMEKVRRLRSGDGETERRYLSKNNANIARLNLLARLFPECRIVIPVRNPWNHAASLLNQHQRFSAIHAADRFSRRYMEWLGHFEFGAGLRPIDFGGWRDAGPQPADGMAFWLAYWIAAHEAILASAPAQAVILDYDRLCAEPRDMLTALARSLEMKSPDRLMAEAATVRPSTPYPSDDEAGIRDLVAKARDIHGELTARSI